MRFEEWKKTQDDQFLCARHVWEAAQKIEREACAKVCEEISTQPPHGHHYEKAAHAIRMRSNYVIDTSKGA